MFRQVQIQEELSRERKKIRSSEDLLLQEAHKLLLQEQFSEKNILSNLKSYTKSFGLLDEEGIDPGFIYSVREIRNICIRYRLRFVDSQVYTGEFPYEVVLKIKDLNAIQRKDLMFFKVLSPLENLKNPALNMDTLLFVQTVYGNYYLVHRWGNSLPASGKIKGFPFRSIETFMMCVITLTALVSLLLPNKYLTTDTHADYFSMYRVACFFHVLILVAGFCVCYLFKTNKSFSVSDWDNPKIN